MLKFKKGMEMKRIKDFLNKHMSFILATLISLLFVILALVYILWNYYYRYTHYSYDSHQELELAYWKCKSEVVDEISDYMNKKVSYHNLSALVILNACDKYGIDVRLPLSQGLIESHYGTCGLASKTNSVFNMGAFDGNKLDKILKIHKYTHPNQSVEPYLSKLRTSYLGDSKTEQDLLNEFVTLSGRRYASYDKYERELKIIWDDINSTTRLDSLLDVYRFLKVELNR